MTPEDLAKLRTRVDDSSLVDIFERLAEEDVERVRPKVRQLNLRIDAPLMEALRAAAADRSIGSHTLARQFIMERLLAELPTERTVSDSRDVQLNLRLDAEALARLKERAHILGVTYHGLARSHLETALQEMGYLAAALSEPLPLAWVTLLMLGSNPTRTGSVAPIRNISRLEKLLFLADKTWSDGRLIPSFGAHRFGPFTSKLYNAERRLSEDGLIDEVPGAPEVRVQTEISLEGIMAVVDGHSEESQAVKEYRITESGLDVVRRFVADARWSTPDVRERLVAHLRRVRERFDGLSLDLLIAYVYLHYPEYTGQSEIRARVQRTIDAHPELAEL